MTGGAFRSMRSSSGEGVALVRGGEDLGVLDGSKSLYVLTGGLVVQMDTQLNSQGFKGCKVLAHILP